MGDTVIAEFLDPVDVVLLSVMREVMGERVNIVLVEKLREVMLEAKWSAFMYRVLVVVDTGFGNQTRCCVAIANWGPTCVALTTVHHGIKPVDRRLRSFSA